MWKILQTNMNCASALLLAPHLCDGRNGAAIPRPSCTDVASHLARDTIAIADQRSSIFERIAGFLRWLHALPLTHYRTVPESNWCGILFFHSPGTGTSTCSMRPELSLVPTFRETSYSWRKKLDFSLVASRSGKSGFLPIHVVIKKKLFPKAWGWD